MDITVSPTKERIFKLRSLGVKFPKYFLKECKKAYKKYPERYYSIKSTLDFVEELSTHIGGENIEVEFYRKSPAIDVKAEVDGKVIAFQIKSLFFTSKLWKLFLESLNNLSNIIGFGQFIKASFVRVGYKNPILTPNVYEYRKVSNLKYSCGAVYCPVENFLPEALQRIRKRLYESNKKLRNINADYKIAVIDLRYEFINEWDAYFDTLINLLKCKYLNGAILVTYDIDPDTYKAGIWPIPVPNLKNPIDWSLIFKYYKIPLPGGRKMFFAMPIKIHFDKLGWQELIEIQPEYRIYYKGIYYGSLI